VMEHDQSAQAVLSAVREKLAWVSDSSQNPQSARRTAHNAAAGEHITR
jgi:hypothetical protein